MSKKKNNNHREWIRKIMRANKLTQNQLYKRLTKFQKKSAYRVMKDKKLSRKQYKDRWNFIGECRMLLEVEDF